MAPVSRLGSSPIPLPKPSRSAPDPAISARGMTGRIANKHKQVPRCSPPAQLAS